MQKTLNDEIWRREIVLASQKAIDEIGRFEHIFKKIEEIIDFKLLVDLKIQNEVNNKSRLIILDQEDFMNKIASSISYLIKKIDKSTKKLSLRPLLIRIIKIIPKTILKKVYNFVLSIKDRVK